MSKMKITKRQLRRIIKEEKRKLLKEAVVKRGFGHSVVTDDEYEKDTSEPPRAETGEPPLTQRSQRKLDHDQMLARINDAMLYLRKLDDPVASEVAQGLDGVVYDMELMSDYFMGDMRVNEIKITKRQLKRIIREAILQEQAAKAQVPKDIQDRIAKIQDPLDREALEDGVDEVWAGEKDLSDLEGWLEDIEAGGGPEELN